jgi:glycosyltransferase involved in cell wall biosynthesis
MKSRPVRVLLVAPCFGDYGGIEAFTLAVADTLMKDVRFEVRVCFKRTTNFVLRQGLAQQCQAYPVEFCSRAGRSLLAAIAWADVVHGQNASLDVAFLTGVLRKPRVLSLHNTLPSRPIAQRIGWQMSASSASVRWYNSHFVWKTWEPREANAASSCVPPTSRLSMAEVAADARRGFVFLGRFVPGKGADVLLEAYRQARLNPAIWPLTFVGDGPLGRALKERSASERIDGVRFAGFIDGEMKARTLGGAKWLVAPSHWEEPFGLVAREARRLGVPCIVTRDGGLPEAAGRDALVCEPGDVNGLTTLLRRAASMPWEEYVLRACRTKDDLSQQQVPISFYLDTYLSLLKRSSVSVDPAVGPLAVGERGSL